MHTIVSQQPTPSYIMKRDGLSCAYNHLRLSSIVGAISQYFALSLDKTPLQYQGHTVWYKRCSALVSGRTHYNPRKRNKSYK